jgi:succinate dehydrogenase flavin-adding protein (antitoxin of CptAB toxin-antitoxin module)
VTTKSLDAESELMLKRLTNHELEAYSQLLELNDWDFLALLQGIKECRDVVMQNVINKISNINV